MNCYEFLAIDKMKLTFTVEPLEDPNGIRGIQTNTSARPTSKKCLRYRCQGKKRYNQPENERRICTREEWSRLALRENYNCLRFAVRKTAAYDSVGIRAYDVEYAISFGFVDYANEFSKAPYPIFFEPWNTDDQYYQKALDLHNLRKQQNKLSVPLYIFNRPNSSWGWGGGGGYMKIEPIDGAMATDRDGAPLTGFSVKLGIEFS